MMRNIELQRIPIIFFGIFIAAGVCLPLPDFLIIQLNYIGLYAITCLGLVLLTGVAGLTSFGQAAFVGIGAYASGWLTLNADLSPWITLFLGFIITGASALLVAMITLRMSGHYLPLATIAWGLSLYYLLGNLDALGKYDGLLGIPGLSLAGYPIGQGRGFFVLTWVLLALSCLGMINLLDSRVGRAMRSIKSGTQMAEAMGIDTFKIKVIIFVSAAGLASLSGWLFAHFQRSINPSPFGLKMGIEYLFMTVIGGAGHVWGAIAGATVTKLLEDQLQVLLPIWIGSSGSYEIIVFGIILVLILQFLPNGLWSIAAQQLPRQQRKNNWGQSPILPGMPNRKPISKGELLLDVRNIRKEFGGLVAVNNLSFEISAGEIVGLIGPNGAGKSTTFNLISGLLHCTSGDVHFCHQSTRKMRSRQIACMGISRTFQHVKMVPEMTVLENVALGAHSRAQKGMLSALCRLDRHEEKQLFKEAERQLIRVGLGDQIHQLAGNLAMGPQRLMEVARALCGDPLLLLLDEPAAGLRHQEKQALANLLKQLQAEGITLLLVEHDMDLVMKVCDRLVVMEFGNLLMQGTPAQVQQSPEVRAAYLGTEH